MTSVHANEAFQNCIDISIDFGSIFTSKQIASLASAIWPIGPEIYGPRDTASHIESFDIRYPYQHSPNALASPLPPGMVGK